MKEFWKRWHISLSSWIRDYLYLPLTGTNSVANAKEGIGDAKQPTQKVEILRCLQPTLWDSGTANVRPLGTYHAPLSFIANFWLLCEIGGPFLKHAIITYPSAIVWSKDTGAQSSLHFHHVQQIVHSQFNSSHMNLTGEHLILRL